MSKESLNPYQAHEKRVDFIEKVVGEGVLEKIPISERNQNIALVYNLNEELSEKDVGEIFPNSLGKPLARQYVQIINKRFLEETWKYASPELQSSHPLSEILARKPGPVGEVNARIKRALEGGASPAEIRNTEGISALQATRRTLRKRGIEIYTAYEDLKARVKAETDDKKLQEILDSFTNASLRGYLKRYNHDPERVFAGLTSVLKKGGFFPHMHLSTFYEKIKEKGIPIRPINVDVSRPKNIYRIVFDKHGQRIIDSLKDDPDLQRFKSSPVKLICGNPDRIPTTADFRKKKRLRQYNTNIKEIIEEVIGHHITGKDGPKFEILLSGCPVPVFRYRHVYIYPIDMIEELKAFLKSKLETI